MYADNAIPSPSFHKAAHYYVHIYSCFIILSQMFLSFTEKNILVFLRPFLDLYCYLGFTNSTIYVFFSNL